MSTVEDSPTSTAEDVVALEVQATVGDTPAAAETVAVTAIKWFDIVEVEEVGFKAFVRLPNDFQHRDIREKAMAAKARRIRQLKHPDTDANVVLESELDALAEADSAKDYLIGELMASRFWQDRDEAVADVGEEEKYENVRQDQERWRDLNAGSVDDRPADEWRELTEHLADYSAAVEKRVEEIQQPRRSALDAMDINELVDRVRERRIDADSRRAFKESYDFWQMYVGTLVIPEDFNPEEITQASMPRVRYFATEADLREGDASVISRLQDTFDALEGGLASLTAGNS